LYINHRKDCTMKMNSTHWMWLIITCLWLLLWISQSGAWSLLEDSFCWMYLLQNYPGVWICRQTHSLASHLLTIWILSVDSRNHNRALTPPAGHFVLVNADVETVQTLCCHQAFYFIYSDSHSVQERLRNDSVTLPSLWV